MLFKQKKSKNWLDCKLTPQYDQCSKRYQQIQEKWGTWKSALLRTSAVTPVNLILLNADVSISALSLAVWHCMSLCFNTNSLIPEQQCHSKASETTIYVLQTSYISNIAISSIGKKKK